MTNEPQADRLTVLRLSGGAIVDDSAAGTGFVWAHLARTAPKSRQWLQKAGLDRFVIDALLAEESRPRCTVHGAGAIVNLRGVNLNPGAEPQDMISVRLWVETGRVISVVQRPMAALDDLREAIARGQGPASPGDFVAKLALHLSVRAEPTVAALNERIDALEEQVIADTGAPASRRELADIRQMSIGLRRHMLPQRDALMALAIEDLDWLAERDRSHVREAADSVIRLGEELDTIRDRAQVVHDQNMDRRSETMNRQMLVLSVVAAIFLPLGLITGLLGINVEGIPGADFPYAFGIVCAVLVAIGAIQIWLFKRAGLF